MKFHMPHIPVPAKGMHPADIVAAVKKCGTNLRQLALCNGFGASTLRAALHKPHPRAQKLIADTIGIPVHKIWPKWFDASGARLTRRIPPDRIRSHSLTCRPAESSPGPAAHSLSSKTAA